MSALKSKHRPKSEHGHTNMRLGPELKATDKSRLHSQELVTRSYWQLSRDHSLLCPLSTTPLPLDDVAWTAATATTTTIATTGLASWTVPLPLWLRKERVEFKKAAQLREREHRNNATQWRRHKTLAKTLWSGNWVTFGLQWEQLVAEVLGWSCCFCSCLCLRSLSSRNTLQAAPFPLSSLGKHRDCYWKRDWDLDLKREREWKKKKKKREQTKVCLNHFTRFIESDSICASCSASHRRCACQSKPSK